MSVNESWLMLDGAVVTGLVVELVGQIELAVENVICAPHIGVIESQVARASSGKQTCVEASRRFRSHRHAARLQGIPAITTMMKKPLAIAGDDTEQRACAP